jgi:tellurite resistance protein
MAFTIESPAEAYAAVSLLAVGADGAGTLQERQALFKKLGESKVFSGQNAEAIGGLLGTLTGRMFSELPNDGMTLEAGAIAEVCTGARSVLNESQRGELFSIAVDLACCDGLEEVERAVLVRIADGLGLEAAAAKATIDRAAK